MNDQYQKLLEAGQAGQLETVTKAAIKCGWPKRSTMHPKDMVADGLPALLMGSSWMTTPEVFGEWLVARSRPSNTSSAVEGR